MVGQISIFDLMVSDMDIWEDFRDNYCSKQGAVLKFNVAGKVDHEDGTAHKACCFTPKNIKEPWDNWQRCTYENCPFLKKIEKKRGSE